MNLTMTAEVVTDADLVLAARRQEPGAYGELFRRWYDRCYDVALNIVRDRETAADVAQDAFLVGWERLMDLRDPEAFGGWILRTARNRALNRVTRDRHRSMEPIEPHEGNGLPDPDPEADPAVYAERSDQRRLIWTAVAALGERDSSLLDLHLRHGLEPAEIAEELRITPNNASQLLFRLRRKLREAIGAVLLWRDGNPTCAGLAKLLDKTGSFDPQVASTIRRHQRECGQCLREITAQTNPERLFAAVPLAVAPLLFKERAAAALAQAGVPMYPVAPVAVPPTTPGPPQGAGRAVSAVAAGLVALGVVTAVLLWPSGGDRHPIAGDRSTHGAPAVLPTTATPTPVGPTPGTKPTSLPLMPLSQNTDPVISRSHAPRRTTPATRTPSATPTRPGPTGSGVPPTGNPGGGGWPTGNPWPTGGGGGGGGGCHHHHHPHDGWWWWPYPSGWSSGWSASGYAWASAGSGQAGSWAVAGYGSTGSCVPCPWAWNDCCP